MSADESRSEPFTSCFAVRAAAEPGALPRLLEAFAKRGLVPSSLHARMSGEILDVEIQVPGVEPSQAEIIAEQLRVIPVVERVLLARMLASAAA